MASIRIHLPDALRQRSSGTRSVMVEAASVPEALSALAEGHPDIGRLLFREPGVLRPHVNVFLDTSGGDRGTPAMLASDSSTLRDGDELRIVPSIAGG